MTWHRAKCRLAGNVRRVSTTSFRPVLEPLETRLLLTTLPDGFVDRRLVSGLKDPTAMEFAPDGRLFVCEQNGDVRIIKDGVLLPEPFVHIDVDVTEQRGLLGMAFHPDFLDGAPYVYVHYTVPVPPIHHRVSYFMADGDTAVAGSEHVVIELDDSSGNTSLNGGAIHFGQDEKLYIATGQGEFAENAQALDSLHGKLLRLNADGTVPTSNPLVSNPAARPEIWARGFRNPFTFAVEPGTNRIYVNDVGSGVRRREEINDLVPGSNYGWPLAEGYTADPRLVSPLFAYGSAFTAPNCSISGGTFYRPATNQFPAGYVGKYFFSDFCGGWIYHLDPNAPNPGTTVTAFATDISPMFLVDLKVSATGSLYYLGRENGGFVSRINYVGRLCVLAHRETLDSGVSGIPAGSDSSSFSPTQKLSEPLQIFHAADQCFVSCGVVDRIASESLRRIEPFRMSPLRPILIGPDPLQNVLATHSLTAMPNSDVN